MGPKSGTSYSTGELCSSCHTLPLAWTSPRDSQAGDPVGTFRYDQAWEFVSAIREGRDCRPSFYHGMRAQAVADSILTAVAERRWGDGRRQRIIP